jgi:LysM repeat protein
MAMAAPRKSSDAAGSTARFLAVSGLAVTGLIVLLVVAGALDGDSGSSVASHPPTTATTTQTRPVERYYVIEQGDTFDAIAEKVGIDSSELQELNPNLDTQQLPVTGCINLVPEGCKALAQGG